MTDPSRATCDGVLVVDKPPGVTSHDVVALARRALRERKIGHTGTLDPMATGVLPLACGRATRLVRFLAASDKDYDAEIRFGVTTDTWDITGTVTGHTGTAPDPEAVAQALQTLRGSYDQVPPPYSAKKVGGQRAYARARRDETVELAPVPVRVTRAELVRLDGATAHVRLTCSAGFYVRAFAHTLGERTGAGACLAALRRTRSGSFGLDQAVEAADLAGGPLMARARLQPLEALLPDWPAIVVTDEGRRRVAHGRTIEPAQVASRPGAPGPAVLHPGGGETWMRVLDPAGRLIALATRGEGVLHPSIVLV